MSVPILYVTGTNTGVGKTFLSALLLRRARERGLKMAAMKPFCSGGHDDSQQLHALQTAGLSLNEVNPFHFDEPVTPLLAARNAKRAIRLPDVLKSISIVQNFGSPILLEGAGGLLSPLGEQLTLREVIAALPGPICVAAPNVLGVINSVLLTLEALPRSVPKIHFVLMQPAQPDASTPANAALIREFSSAEILEIPFIQNQANPQQFFAVAPTLDAILSSLRA